VAPSTYYANRARPPSARARRDEIIGPALRGLWEDNYRVYGARKLWKAARRAGHDVGRDQVARHMRAAGIAGTRRGKRVRTTKPDPAAGRHPDLVGRDFTANGPNQLWVTDLTFVPTWAGVAHVCFITDAFSRMIVGWRVAGHMRTTMVLDAIEMARWSRGKTLPGLRFHSDAGSQAGFNWSSQHLDSSEVCGGVWEAAVGGSCVSGADALPGAAVGGLAGGQGQVLGGDRCRGDDGGRRGRSGRVFAGWVPLVPPCWRRESTLARNCFGPLPILE